MAEPVQLEQVVQRLIEHYTRSVKEALAGEKAGASAAEERVSVALQRLNQRLERQVAAVTQDLQAEAVERRRAEVWLQGLIQTTQDAVISIDRQGRIVRFNPSAERMFGYSQAEIIGRKLTLLMPEPYAREHDGYIERYERTGEARAIGRIRTVEAKRKTGELFPIELSVTKVRTEAEIRYSAFIRDISEKVQLQERLLEREHLAAIGTTAAAFAHEVGNPLNSMSLTAQILERRLVKRSEPAEENILTPLRTLMGEIHRLSLLLDEFRTLARPLVLQCKLVQLAELVSEVLTAEAPGFAAAGVQLTQRLPPDLPLVSVDSEKLKRAVLNVCKNAREAMPQGGTRVGGDNPPGLSPASGHQRHWWWHPAGDGHL